jgi:opacity protein-like surface antigen
MHASTTSPCAARDSSARRPLRDCALVLACVLMLANAAIAEEGPEPPPYARPGAYVSLGGVAGLPNFDDPLPNPSAGGGVDARLGYRVGARTAIELAYTGTFGSTNRFPGPPPRKSQFATHLVAANARVFMATERIQPYVLVGMGALISHSKLVGPAPGSSTQAAYAVRLGAGTDVYASEHWVVEIEGSYVIGTGRLEHRDYGLVGASAMYRF